MTDSIIRSTVADLVKAFTDAPEGRVDAEYARLVAALWTRDGATAAATTGVPVLLAELEDLDPDRQGYALVLLGVLAEAEWPAEGPVFKAVRAGLDVYLDLIPTTSKGQPLSLALLYLLSHFPADRAAIIAGIEPWDLEADDHSRIVRALADVDLANPDLGRVWPAPSTWALGDDEKDFSQAWIKGLTEEQIKTNWDNDTRTVLGYTGARAYYSVVNRVPASRYNPSFPEDAVVLPTPSDDIVSVFGKYADVLRCPTSHAPLEVTDAGVRSTDGTKFAVANGILDLSAGVREGQEADDATNDLLQKLAEMPTMGLYYEAVLRPHYLRIAGGNWGDQVSPADEDAYLARHSHPAEGPVLDLAAGAGRWTKIVAGAVGSDRLIALDMALPMLNVLRGALPEVPAVKASALNLPFADGVLGGLNCWNALQAFPDDAEAAIAEMGRVLKPGGTMTMMTFIWSDDQVARHFQEWQFFPSRPEGHLLFELDELHQWFEAAGLRITEEQTGEGTFVFLTAERA
ncbi:MAG TPA: class I SAM-dependent methyltransferase [Actinokineospora sp.]|nr:class I SAM-dependent methyltransferase [Actinokineospora sp.]